jgi:hypothetical protein
MINTAIARPMGKNSFQSNNNNNHHLDSNVYPFRYSPNGGVYII